MLNVQEFFRGVCKTSKSDFELRHACLSVCPSARYNSAPTARICISFCIWKFFRKSIHKIQVSIQSDENNGYMCNVCVCVGVLIICVLYSEVFLNLTEVFPCFFLSCKANARVKLVKTGHGPHLSTLVVICVVRLLIVLFYILFVCKCVLPPGDNPTAVNKCIISYCMQT